MKMKITNSRSPWIPLAIALAFYFLHPFPFENAHELELMDLRFRLRGEQPADARILLITIDDQSLAKVGVWPWPRAVYAAFLDLMGRYEPKQIFFDILFTEQGKSLEGDLKFQEAIARAGNVILSLFYSEDSSKVFFPIEGLRKAARSVGFANAAIDQDGNIRRFQPELKVVEGNFSHPAVLMAGEDRLRKFQRDRRGNIWINFPGAFKSFRSVSFGEIINLAGLGNDQKLRELISGASVLVGHTATGTTDLKPTPFSNQSPGLMVQASALDTLLKKGGLREIPRALSLLVMLAMAMGLSYLASHKKPLVGLGATLGILVVYAGFSHLVFSYGGWLIPVFLPLAIGALSFLISTFIRFLEVRFQQERLDQELKIAAQIQKSFLPPSAPSIAGVDMAFECQFAREVGGDLYDWHDLGEGCIGFCVGDVSGKGMPGAIYMAKAISDLRSIDKRKLSPGKILRELNERLLASETPGMFLTLFYVILDTRSAKLTFASAGHEPAIYFNNKTQKCELVQGAKGVPLGTFSGMDYESAELIFQPGDGLLLFSDGVRELRNNFGKEYGMDRLENDFLKAFPKAQTAEEVISDLDRVLEIYREEGTPHDDRTFLCLKKLR